MTTLPDVLQIDQTLIGLDLETTGTNVQQSRIVEIGLQIMVPGEPVREWHSLVNPGVAIPHEATTCHGITDEQIASAPRFPDIADNLLKGFIDADYVGYNLRFDLRILAAEFDRYNYVWSYESARLLDGYRVWQIVEARTLEDAVERWLGHPLDFRGEDRDRLHGAMFDTRHSTLVLASQLVQCEQVPRTVQEIHDLCWPGWFDQEGKLRWRNGELCFTFGANRDQPLRLVRRSYLSWIIRNEFSDKVKDTCRDALLSIYPSQPIADADDS